VLESPYSFGEEFIRGRRDHDDIVFAPSLAPSWRGGPS
jgi:hypothetical protein